MCNGHIWNWLLISQSLSGNFFFIIIFLFVVRFDLFCSFFWEGFSLLGFSSSYEIVISDFDARRTHNKIRLPEYNEPKMQCPVHTTSQVAFGLMQSTDFIPSKPKYRLSREREKGESPTVENNVEDLHTHARSHNPTHFVHKFVGVCMAFVKWVRWPRAPNGQTTCASKAHIAFHDMDITSQRRCCCCFSFLIPFISFWCGQCLFVYSFYNHLCLWIWPYHIRFICHAPTTQSTISMHCGVHNTYSSFMIIISFY